MHITFYVSRELSDVDYDRIAKKTLDGLADKFEDILASDAFSDHDWDISNLVS